MAAKFKNRFLAGASVGAGEKMFLSPGRTPAITKPGV